MEIHYKSTNGSLEFCLSLGKIQLRESLLKQALDQLFLGAELHKRLGGTFRTYLSPSAYGMFEYRLQ